MSRVDSRVSIDIVLYFKVAEADAVAMPVGRAMSAFGEMWLTARASQQWRRRQSCS